MEKNGALPISARPGRISKMTLYVVVEAVYSHVSGLREREHPLGIYRREWMPGATLARSLLINGHRVGRGRGRRNLVRIAKPMLIKNPQIN